MHSSGPQRNDDIHSEQARLVNAPRKDHKPHLELPSSDVIVTNTVLVLKSLVQRQLMNSDGHENKLPTTVVSRLALLVDDIKHPKSRSCAVWLVGQYACLKTARIDALDGIAEWAPDVLRRTCKSFPHEVRSFASNHHPGLHAHRSQRSSYRLSA